MSNVDMDTRLHCASSHSNCSSCTLLSCSDNSYSIVVMVVNLYISYCILDSMSGSYSAQYIYPLKPAALLIPPCNILYFVWEDQSNVACRIVHTVLISCITVLYESYRTVMQLIGKIQYSYAESLFKECYINNTL